MTSAALFGAKQLPADSVGLQVLALVADAVICTDERGCILLYNRAAERTFGYSESEVIGRNVAMLLPERYRSAHVEQVRSFATGARGTDRLMGHNREIAGRRKNGEEFPAEATISRQTVNGRAILTVVHRDISERKKLEEQRETVARELDHRIRNLFSVVNSLVRLSAKGAATVGEFEHSLLERLDALSRTQNVFRIGPQQSTSLSDLLLAELDQYRSSNEENIILEVVPVSLSSRSAQSLALAVHELATNSAKYGALSAAGGHVTVTSTFSGEEGKRLLTIEWRESGGPPVKPPERQGFGTILVKQLLTRALGADTVLAYPPEGFVCRMTLPTNALTATAAH